MRRFSTRRMMRTGFRREAKRNDWLARRKHEAEKKAKERERLKVNKLILTPEELARKNLESKENLRLLWVGFGELFYALAQMVIAITKFLFWIAILILFVIIIVPIWKTLEIILKRKLIIPPGFLKILTRFKK